MRTIHLTVIVLTGILVGCAQASATFPAGSDPAQQDAVLVIADGDPDVGSGLSVAQALEHRPTDDLVSVSGGLFVAPDGTVRLCDAIAESFPPQCGGARLEVRGLDVDAVPNLQEANGVRWAEGVTLFGSVE